MKIRHGTASGRRHSKYLARAASKRWLLWAADIGLVVLDRPLGEQLRLSMEHAGFVRVRVTEMQPLTWRLTMAHPSAYTSDKEIVRQVKAVVRDLGQQPMVAGVGIERWGQRIAIMLLFEPKNGKWPRPEEFLPERFRVPEEELLPQNFL